MPRTLFALLLASSFYGCATPRTATSVLEQTKSTIGDPGTIEFEATGTSGWMGQSPLADDAWPKRPLISYTRRINYAQKSGAEQMVFAEEVFGGQRQNTQVNGDKAWNLGANGPAPQNAAAEERQLQLWLTPHGFVKGALAAGDATFADANGVSTISFKALDRYTVTGEIDAQHQVTKVSTITANPVLGDTPWVAHYSDYADFSGVKFPKKMLVTHGGPMLWDLAVTSVTPNAAFDLPVPEAVASAPVPPVRIASSKVADGVWFIGGGSHHSVVVEFGDHLAVVEAPLGDERSVAVIAEAKRLAPGKPIKYLVTSHHHFDHTGGFRTYVAEGATIVTHQSNVNYFTKAAAAPATIIPDTLARTPKPAVFEGVSEKKVLTDSKQTIEIYPTSGDSHTGEYTLVYLPRARALIEADAWSPGAPDAPPPAVVPPNALRLYDDVQALKLNVATVIGIHGRGPVPMAEFSKYVGRVAH